MWALQAKAARFAKIDDLAQATAQPYVQSKFDRERYFAHLTLMRGGPGRMVRWEDTLTDVERVELEKSSAEALETLKKFQAAGLIGDDPNATAAEAMLSGRFGKPAEPGPDVPLSMTGAPIGQRIGGQHE